MVSLEKWMILTPLQKLPKNEEDWGKLIVAKGFKRLPKVQNIAQSGHTGCYLPRYLVKKALNGNVDRLGMLLTAAFVT